MSRFLLKGIIILSISLFFELLSLKFYPYIKVLKLSNSNDQPTKNYITNSTKEIKEKNTTDYELKDIPQEIYFPSLKLNIDIAPGEIILDKWTLYDDKASWLSTSDDPDSGNVIIYAHNRKGLFGSLKNLKLKDSIIVKAKNIADIAPPTTLFDSCQPKKNTPIGAIITEIPVQNLYKLQYPIDVKELAIEITSGNSGVYIK